MDDENEAIAEPSAVETAILRQIQWLNESVEKAVELIEPQQRLFAAESEFGRRFDAVSVCWMDFDVTVTVSSSAEVVDLLRVLARHGFRRKQKSRPVRNDYDPTRVKFALERVDLAVVNKGATCRRVKTGEKLIDVYEIVCDDPTDDSPEYSVIGGSPSSVSALDDLGAEAARHSG